MKKGLQPLQVAGFYAAFGVSWIVISDWLASLGGPQSYTPISAQTVKGLLYVALTAALVYLLVRRLGRDSERERRWYRELFALGPNPCFVFDGAGRLKQANDKAIERYGYSRERLLRLDAAALAPPAHREAWLANLEEARSSGRHRVAVHCNRAGEEFEVEFRARCIDDSQGLCLCVLHDLSPEQRAARALRESEAKYRLLVEHQSDMVVKVDAEGRFLFVSPNYCRSFGKSEEELLGSTFLPMIHPEDQPATARAMQSLAEPPHTCYIEQRAMTVEGWRWLSWADRALLDDAGRIESIIGVGRDITERKRRQGVLDLRLRLSEALPQRPVPELLRMALDEAEALTASRIGFCHFVHEDQRRFSPQAWSSNTDQACRTQTQDGHRSIDEAGLWAECMENGHTLICNDYPARRRPLPEGHPTLERLLVTPVRRGGRAVALFGVGNKGRDYDDHDAGLLGDLANVTWDLVQQKQAVDALRESEIRNRAIVSALPDILFRFDRGGRFVDCHAPDPEMLILKPEQFLGHSCEEVLPEYLARLTHEKIEATLATGEAQHYEYEVEHQGETRHFEARMVPCGPSEVLCIVRDTTAAKRAERERLELERKMQQSQRLESLGVLAGGIAHDFNNLLMAILGNAEMAAADLPPLATAQESLDNIVLSTQKAADLCKQMLAYAGQGRYMSIAIDLNDLIADMRALLESSLPRKARLAFRLDGRPARIQGDPGQLRQVLLNLVTNAGEALGDQAGTVTIRCCCERADADTFREAPGEKRLPEGEYACIEVADDGAGMDPSTLEHLFEPFFTTKFTGRGLGLPATLGIVQSHGGTMTVHSRPDQGARFRVYLPLIDARNALPAATDRERYCVLLANDDTHNRHISQRMLERLGCSVICADGQRQALDCFRDHHHDIDLVLVDLQRYESDGVRMVTQIRELDSAAALVLASPCDEEELDPALRSMPGLKLLAKPYSLDTLRRLLIDPARRGD